MVHLSPPLLSPVGFRQPDRVFELGAGLLVGEPPVNGRMALIALRYERHHLLLQGLHVGHRPGEAATLKDANFDLGLVEPATVLGRVVPLHYCSRAYDRRQVSSGLSTSYTGSMVQVRVKRSNRSR